jgi:uncharacterized protein (TIGR03435 family)
MNWMRQVIAGLGAAVLASCGLFGQTAATPPAFEVASIKPAPPQTGGRMMTRTGGDAGRVDYANVNLKQVLMRAYDVKTYQITGPAWLDTERYDIVAKVPEGVPKEQIPAMLQNLLAERFQMTIHRETKEQGVYALVVGKNGPKLKKSDDSEAAVVGFGGPGSGPPPPPPPPGGASGGMAKRPTGAGPASGTKGTMGAIMFSINSDTGTSRMQAKTTMAGLTNTLSNMLDRPVVDMTEIQGTYDISLELASDELVGMLPAMAAAGRLPRPPADGAATPAPDSAPAASIFTSIQQLGLKLEPRRVPTAYIVVDKAERVPTEN